MTANLDLGVIGNCQSGGLWRNHPQTHGLARIISPAMRLRRSREDAL